MGSYDELSLEQIAAQTKAHIKVGDKHKDKAEQQYIAAGLYLIEAKKRVKGQGGSWLEWVRVNVEISDRRARELMQIAGGDTTLEEMRERAREGMARSRQAQPQKANWRNVTPKSRPKAPPPPPPKPSEEELRVRKAHAIKYVRIETRLRTLTVSQLEAVEDFINSNFGN